MSAVSIQITPAQDPVNPVVPQVNDSLAVAELTQPLLSTLATLENVQPKEREWVVCYINWNELCPSHADFMKSIEMCIAVALFAGIVVITIWLTLTFSHWYLFLAIGAFIALYYLEKIAKSIYYARADQSVSKCIDRLQEPMIQAEREKKNLSIEIYDLGNQKIFGELSKSLSTELTHGVSRRSSRVHIVKMTLDQIRERNAEYCFLRKWKTENDELLSVLEKGIIFRYVV